MTTNADIADRERSARRAKFNEIFESIEGDDAARVAKICTILGYKPHTVRVLRVKTEAYKVIPQAKLDILQRELAREAQATASQAA